MSETIGQSNNRPTRPAWLEVDLGQLAENFRLIRADAPDGLAIGSVVKDAAYGHGAVEVARVALGQGALDMFTRGSASAQAPSGLSPHAGRS